MNRCADLLRFYEILTTLGRAPVAGAFWPTAMAGSWRLLSVRAR